MRHNLRNNLTVIVFYGVAQMVRILDVAKHAGLTKLEAEFNGERKNTMLSFNKCGFIELVRLRDYLQDMQAQPHDYVLLGMNLTTDLEYAGAGD